MPRKPAGKTPGSERRDQAVEIGRAGAERDQAEHVQAAVHDRRPGALEERPAGPQHDRRREHELQPGRTRRGGTRSCRPSAGIWPPISSTTTGSVSTSPIQKRRRHVDQFGVRPGLGRHLERLQRHAADRAVARPSCRICGMHRAGVDRALRRGRRRGFAAFGAGSCPGAAMNFSRQRAEQKKKRRPVVLEPMLGGRRVRPSCRRPGRSRCPARSAPRRQRRDHARDAGFAVCHRHHSDQAPSAERA